MHFGEILSLDLLLSDQPAMISGTNARHSCGSVKTDSEFHLFQNGNARNGEVQGMEGDSLVGIEGAFEPETEGIIDGLVVHFELFGEKKETLACNF